MTGRAAAYIEKIPLWTKKKNSTEDIKRALAGLGIDQSRMRIIHVAGTNGKGSVCAALTSLLCARGHHTGTFISPHLIRLNERFLLDGRPAEDEILDTCFDRVQAVVSDMEDTGFVPSFFEYCFLLAMELFREEKTDTVILETGLGGRLDATNAAECPAACIITSIGMDHMQQLGNTIEEIAFEKAGIIKPGSILVYDAGKEAASAVIEKVAAKKGVSANPLDEAGALTAYPFLNGIYAAVYQRMNAALALKTLSLLGETFSQAEILSVLGKAMWPARMQKLGEDIWLDGAHNADGMAAFVRAAGELAQKKRPVCLVFGASADKDVRGMVKTLCAALRPDYAAVTGIASNRSANPSDLKELFMEYGRGCRTESFLSAAEAFGAAVREKGDGVLFCLGSLYLAGELLTVLENPREYTGGFYV